MLNLLIGLLVAALAYLLMVEVTHERIVGIVAAIVVLIVAAAGPDVGWPRRRT